MMDLINCPVCHAPLAPDSEAEMCAGCRLCTEFDRSLPWRRAALEEEEEQDADTAPRRQG